MKFKAFLFMSLCLFVCACRDTEIVSNGIEVPLQKEGVYSVSSDLKLYIDQNKGLINYKLMDNKQKVLLNQKQASPISSHQKWAFYYDTLNNNLWISSSDIGILVWRKGQDGIYYKSFFNDSLRSEIPAKLLTVMPESMKKFDDK